MREAQDSTEEIIQGMLSADPRKIWYSSCAICSWSQNHSRVMELLPYRQQMEQAIQGIPLGGALAPNSRFAEKAFQIIDFHAAGEGCPCCLVDEDAKPLHLVEDGYFSLLDTVYFDAEHYEVDHYIVRCNSCGAVYKAEKREYHYTWWYWTKLQQGSI